MRFLTVDFGLFELVLEEYLILLCRGNFFFAEYPVSAESIEIFNRKTVFFHKGRNPPRDDCNIKPEIFARKSRRD